MQQLNKKTKTETNNLKNNFFKRVKPNETIKTKTFKSELVLKVSSETKS
jgi:hypothetical protein